MRDPVGPLPPGVYWWRRTAVLVVALAVLIGFVVLVTGGGSSKPASSLTPRSPRHSASATGTTHPRPSNSAPTSSATRTSTGNETCAVSALSATVETSDARYPKGTAPRFTVTLATSGPACSAPGPVSVVVTSGGDRVWGSHDCPANAPDGAPTKLAAGGKASTAFTWQRNRTSPGCVTVNGDRTAKSGTYTVRATWAGVTSSPVAFVLE